MGIDMFGGRKITESEINFGRPFTIFLVSRLTVITLNSKSRIYLGLLCSVAQSIAELTFFAVATCFFVNLISCCCMKVSEIPQLIIHRKPISLSGLSLLQQYREVL